MNFTTYKISIKGLNLHRIISLLEKEKIHLSNVEQLSQKELVCNITKKDFLKIKNNPILTKYKLKIIHRFGAEGIIRSIIAKIGLFAGIIVMTFTTLNITNKIQLIEINTAGHICQNEDQCIFKEDNLKLIYSTLEKYGIKKNKSVIKIKSNKEIKNNLLIDFPQISDVSIKRHGSKISINILEAKITTNNNSPNLIATENGIVIKTEVNCGKLKVKNGDVVIKGQTLIESTGTPVSGTIILRSFFNENAIFNEVNTNFIYTGRKMQINNISIFNLNLKSTKKCNFNIYECKKRTKYTFLNLFLPIKITQNAFFELKKVETTLNFNEHKNNILINLENKTKNKIPLNAQIINTNFTFKKEGTRHLINCYIETYLTIKK